MPDLCGIFGGNGADLASIPDSLGPIPAGDYTACVESSELKATRDGKGQRVVLKIKILDGQHKGRTIYEGLNIVNASETAERIGRAELKRIAAACGVTGTLQQTEQLHGVPFLIRLGVKRGGEGSTQEFVNVIKKCASRAAGLGDQTEAAQAGGDPAAAAVSRAAASDSAPPWMR